MISQNVFFSWALTLVQKPNSSEFCFESSLIIVTENQHTPEVVSSCKNKLCYALEAKKTCSFLYTIIHKTWLYLSFSSRKNWFWVCDLNINALSCTSHKLPNKVISEEVGWQRKLQKSTWLYWGMYLWLKIIASTW